MKLWLAVLMLPLFAYQQDQPKNPPIKVKSELVNLEVVVTDPEGRRVGGLQREDFEVYEDDVKREITHFSAEQRPLKILLLFDLSMSMEAALPVVQQAATKLVDSLGPEDAVMIVTFAQQTTATTDWTNDRNAARLQILQLMPATLPWRKVPRNVNAGSLPDVNTNLYGALKYVFETISRQGEHGAVVMFSDGVDSVDRYTLRQRNLDEEDVVHRAEESLAAVYCACFKTRSNGLPRGNLGPWVIRRAKTRGYGNNCKFLSRVGGGSGGKMFDVQDRSGLDAFLEQTMADLHTQYTLAYRPLSDKSGFHKIRVVMKRPNLLAQYRKGYRR